MQYLRTSNVSYIHVYMYSFVEVSRIVTGNPRATAADGSACLRALVADLSVPGVSELCGGISLEAVPEIARLTARASSTKGNPVTLTVEEIEAILRKAL